VRIGTGHPGPRLGNPDRAQELGRLAGRAGADDLHRYWCRTAEAKRGIGANLNPQLLLEDLLLHWTGLFVAPPRTRTSR
jgi:hypothetical protein